MSIKLVDYQQEVIERGTLIRCKAKYPYEEVVDFLVCENIGERAKYKLIVATGYKAGLVFCILPKESVQNCGISTNWLIENWEKWGYFDCAINDVYLVENEVPQYPECQKKRLEEIDNPSNNI